ncbi:MAG: WD40 repeat domain-containing protein [Thermoguttaceae bacterium]|nr:WD40 repeat domain-containing protein [Thermoguttaceae bacterium]
MSQDQERPKLKIPEFKKDDAEVTWWVNGRDTKPRSTLRRERRRRFIYTIIFVVMILVFGGAVLTAAIYGIMYSLRPVGRDVLTPKAEIVQTFTPGHKEAIQDLKFSPDGLFIVTASNDSTALVLDAFTGDVVRRLEGHKEGVTSVAMVSLLREPTEDRDKALAALRILTGGKDIRAIFWNTEMNPPIHQRLGESDDAVEDDSIFGIPTGHTKAIMDVALSADGRYALTGSLDNSFLLWDTTTHSLSTNLEGKEDMDALNAELKQPHNGPVLAVAFNPNGSSYASGSEDCTIKIWDSNSDLLISTLTGHNSAVTTLEYGSSGNIILSGSRDQRAYLWNVNGTQRQMFQAENEIIDAEISQNERYVLTNMYENTAVLWDAKTAEKLVQFEAPERITALALSPVQSEGFPLYVAVATVENRIVVFSTKKLIEKLRKRQ